FEQEVLGAPVSLPPGAPVVEAVPVALAVPAVPAVPPVPVIRPIIATNTYQQVALLVVESSTAAATVVAPIVAPPVPFVGPVGSGSRTRSCPGPTSDRPCPAPSAVVPPQRPPILRPAFVPHVLQRSEMKRPCLSVCLSAGAPRPLAMRPPHHPAMVGPPMPGPQGPQMMMGPPMQRPPGPPLGPIGPMRTGPPVTRGASSALTGLYPGLSAAGQTHAGEPASAFAPLTASLSLLSRGEPAGTQPPSMLGGSFTTPLPVVHLAGSPDPRGPSLLARVGLCHALKLWSLPSQPHMLTPLTALAPGSLMGQLCHPIGPFLYNNQARGTPAESPRCRRRSCGSHPRDPVLPSSMPDDFRIFCGDLGNEVNDDILARAFSRYPSFLKAKVIRDKRTGKTKGYGFVSFKDPNDYVRAMREMNGKYVGSRPIKLRKSMWKDRNIDVVRKKQKEKKKLGLR
uniref:RNA-binding protein 42 n=1 Tax=Pelodiscus sinensis TaxID=13735 RepID=K7G5R4_PELSI